MSTNCSSTCATQDHATYGECIRAKGLRIAYCNSAGGGGDATAQKKWDKDLDAYRAAVRQGMEPETTRIQDVNAAVRWSEKNGVAYSSDTKHSVDLNTALTRAA